MKKRGEKAVLVTGKLKNKRGSNLRGWGRGELLGKEVR